jgi:signal transduction histidine kinase
MIEDVWILISIGILAFFVYCLGRFIKNFKLCKSIRAWKIAYLALLLVLSYYFFYLFTVFAADNITYEEKKVIILYSLMSLFVAFSLNFIFRIKERLLLREEKLINLNFVLDNETQLRADEFENKAGDLEDKNKQLAMQAEILSEREEELRKINLQLNDAHKQLEKEKNSVEQKVIERTKELNKEKETVETLLKQKTEFINQLSHDLRTPLTPLLNLLPFLKKNDKNKKDIQLIDICIKNTNYLQKLVLSTLSLARIDAKNVKLELSKNSVYEVLKDITNQGLFNSKSSKIRIINNVDRKISLSFDKLRMREVFENIISNAIKYNESRTKEIVVSSAVKGKMIELYFTDNGIGIEPKNLNMIFTEFYKVDPSRHQHDSSGLGLSISKRIIELHKGNIHISSKGINKGVTITIQLPSG